MNKLNRILDIQQQPINILFVSSYQPRKCGIATFTKDLTKAINDLNPKGYTHILAMNNHETHQYPHEVVYQIQKDTVSDYVDASQFINSTTADLVCLQHEFGLFGGMYGQYIFKLLKRLRLPLVVTLHTVLSTPTEEQCSSLTLLAELADALVVMTPDAKILLEETYSINPDKVAIIHHGVADRPKAIQADKQKHGWSDKKVLLLTGLLNPDKGIEYVIQALPGIKAQFPNVLFVIAGQTHPEIIKQFGESYREYLRQLIEALGVTENVQFIDTYLSLDELLSLYEACDIYLTPHLNPEQIASGTLAYAIGMGKACISTPFVYAKDILAQGTGLFVDYKSSSSIQDAVLKILTNPELQKCLEDKAYTVGRRQSWPLVAERYLVLFRTILKHYESVSL